MADISKITLLDGNVVDIKDSAARQSITSISSELSGKVSVFQGTQNIGKILQVSSDGSLDLEAFPSIPTKTSDLTNDSGYLTQHQDISGKADLDEHGIILASQLPSYVDDVLEYASLGNFPLTGESGKIYIAIDTNLSYRWSGSGYIEISPSLALGETSSTAYRGDRGKTAYDHAALKGSEYSSGLYKITTNSEGHVTNAVAVAKSDITGLGIPAQDTTYSNATTSTAGLMSSTDKTKLDGIADGATANVGTITGITMNGSSKGTSGIVDLGTVLTSHQSISHLAPKASPVFTGSISLGRDSDETIGSSSIAIGSVVTASGMNSQAFGWWTTASGSYSFAEGSNNEASGNGSHAGGTHTVASGYYSHAEGKYTTAKHVAQYAFGQYSIEDVSTATNQQLGTFIEIVGNGTSETKRSNARTLDWSGNQRLKGTLYVNANADGTGGTQVLARGVTWAELEGT